MEQEKIVFDDNINTVGRNIRWIRKSLKIRQTELVARLQLCHVDITRETLVKIEGGRQHIKLSQLRGIRDELGVLYEDILDQPGEELSKRVEQLNSSENGETRKKKIKKHIIERGTEEWAGTA